MSDSSFQDLVAGARAYEQLFVPALFGQWAPHVLEAAQVGPGESLLDVACGTGVLARNAVEVVGSEGTVTGVDPNPGMLEVAKEGSPKVRWIEGAAEKLPFADGEFDAVVSQFGLMFFTNRVGALAEMARVVGPTGHLAVAVWDAVENQAGFAVQLDLIERHAGSAAAAASRAPFALGDPDELSQLFDQAGLGSAVVRTLAGTARFPTIQSLVEAELRGWLPVMGVHLEEGTIETILREAEDALVRYQDESGTLEFPVRAHLVTVEKQQQLRLRAS